MCGIREVDPRGNCLPFQTALEIAQDTEAAMKNSKSLNEGEPRVNALAKVCTGVVKEPIIRISKFYLPYLVKLDTLLKYDTSEDARSPKRGKPQ